MANQLAFYFNSSTCIGCKTCQIACKDKNNLPVGTLWRRVFSYEAGSWNIISGCNVPNSITGYHVSTSCQHCQDPKCVEVCPTGAAFKRSDGVVLIDQDQCVGCRYCEWACPYSAPQFNEEQGYMEKCNFCVDLIEAGESPACVSSCPVGALEFGELEDLRAKYGDLAAIEPLPVDDITNPALVITPHKNAQLSGQGTGRIVNLPEEI